MHTVNTSICGHRQAKYDLESVIEDPDSTDVMGRRKGPKSGRDERLTKSIKCRHEKTKLSRSPNNYHTM